MKQYQWSQHLYYEKTQPGDIHLHLRWTERDPRVVAGVWQVTTLAPPASNLHWENPPGLIAHGPVVLPAEGDNIDISFPPHAPSPPPVTAPPIPPSSRRSQHVRPPAGPVAGRPSFQLIATRFSGLLAPTRFYVRLVGLDSAGNTAGWPSNAVEIEYGRPIIRDTMIDSSKREFTESQRRQFEEQRQVQLASLPLRVELQRFDPGHAATPGCQYHWVATRDFSTIGHNYHKGDQLTFTPKSDSWLDDVCDAIGDAAEGLADAADWVSGAWDDIKGTVVDVVARVLPGCGPPCRQGLAMGLEYGLATAGIPPSLPDFDQMAQLSRGYIVETLAAEAAARMPVPVPPEAIEEIADRFLDTVSERANHGSSFASLRPDPAFQEIPPRAYVKVWSQSSAIERDYQIVILFWSIYLCQTVPLPPLRRGASIVVPVTLYPDFDCWTRRLQSQPGRKTFANESEVRSAWQKAHSTTKQSFTVWLCKTGPAHRTTSEIDSISIDHWSGEFVAAGGYPTVAFELGPLGAMA